MGIICINYATRKGATRLVKSAKALPEDCRTGIVPAEKRISMGEETINPMSMDPLAWLCPELDRPPWPAIPSMTGISSIFLILSCQSCV